MNTYKTLEHLSASNVPCSACGAGIKELCTNGVHSPAPLFNGMAHGKDGFRDIPTMRRAIKNGRNVTIHSHATRIKEYRAHSRRVYLGHPSWDQPEYRNAHA